jgi:hypothetical protein
MKPGSVISSVGADRYDAAPGRDAGLSQHFQEWPEGLAVESPRFSPKQELAGDSGDVNQDSGGM